MVVKEGNGKRKKFIQRVARYRLVPGYEEGSKRNICGCPSVALSIDSFNEEMR